MGNSWVHKNGQERIIMVIMLARNSKNNKFYPKYILALGKVHGLAKALFSYNLNVREICQLDPKHT